MPASAPEAARRPGLWRGLGAGVRAGLRAGLRAGAGAALLALALAAAGADRAAAQAADLVSRSALRVCADPAGWPASAEDGSGYENAIAELVADELGVPVEYTWYPMTTGFVRRTLGAAECDVIVGYGQGDELVLNTNAWLTSSYVTVARADGPFAGIAALEDPRLRDARIGIVAGTPPVTHLARLGLLDRIRSYQLFADRRYDSPPDRMIEDLEAGLVDVALMWGPIAGPMVAQRHPDLVATPLLDEPAMPPLVFRITMGVRPGEDRWKRELNAILRRNQDRIDAILREAGVPVLDDMGTALKPEG